MFAKIAPIAVMVLAVLLYLWGNGVAGCKRRSAAKASSSPVPAVSATPKLSATPRKKRQKPTPVCTPTPKPTPIYIPQKRLEVGRIFNGMQFKAQLETEPGGTATVDRETPGSYSVEVTVRVKVPKANTDMASLSKINPALPELLPGLPAMLEKGRVSPKYEALYARKLAEVQGKLLRLDQMLTRHNFYDCETILELRHPRTKRTAVLLQADMDVDTDGSDPDRLPAPNASDPTFQPMTSYKWPKQTVLVNPFLASRQARLRAAEAKLSEAKGVSSSLRQVLRDQVGAALYEVNQLKKYSFLIAATDPYVVLPGLMADGMDPAFQPKVGDYCAVIHDHAIYPAIVGDIGPKNLVGEASMRIGKEINSETSGLHRPESKLKVTYLFFPGTADEPAPPDLDKWHARVAELLDEIGGHGGDLHTWVNLSRPAPTPTPPPTPTPTPSPTPSPSPSASPSASPAAPGASPSVSPVPSPCPPVTPCPTPPVCPSPSPSASSTPTPSASPAPKTTPKPAQNHSKTTAKVEKKSTKS